MDNEKIINEVFGGQNKHITSGKVSNPGTHLQNSKNNVNVRRGTVPTITRDSEFHKSHLTKRLRKPDIVPKGWQNLMISNVKHGNVNMFINVAPSAGKTYPLLKAYRELLKNAKPGRIPKIVWVAETKLLSAQITRELQETLYEALIEGDIPKFMVAPFFKDIPDFDKYNDLRSIPLTPNQTYRIREMIKSWTGTVMQATAEADPPTKHSIAITCTYSFATKMIKEYNPALVVIDEVQERFKPELTSAGSESDKVRHFFNNVIAADKSPGTSIAILTGSMNHVTGKYIVSYLNNYVNSKFQYIDFTSNSPGSMGERNRAFIKVLPTDLTRKEIPSLIIDQIKGKNQNNLIAIFSKNAIIKITEDVVKNTPSRNMAAVIGIPDSKLRDKYMSQSRTLHGLDNKKPEETLGSSAKRTKERGTPEYLYDLYVNMKDPDLKSAIEHGFGYIIAGDEAKGRVYDNDDIYLVEELFKRGLIYTVLATTTVGVGVNLKVRALYIPKIDVFSQDIGGMKPMSASSLAQMVHRVGRKADESGVVYCNKSDIDLISKIMKSGDPSKHVDIIPFSGKGSTVSIMDRFKYARAKWYQDTTIYKLITQKDV